MLDDDLDYQSEEALTFLGQVIGEQERFDEFEAVAKQMGSRAWKRIIRLADITPASKFRMLLHTNPTRERGECLGTRAGASEDM